MFGRSVNRIKKKSEADFLVMDCTAACNIGAPAGFLETFKTT